MDLQALCDKANQSVSDYLNRFPMASTFTLSTILRDNTPAELVAAESNGLVKCVCYSDYDAPHFVKIIPAS